MKDIIAALSLIYDLEECYALARLQLAIDSFGKPARLDCVVVPGCPGAWLLQQSTFPLGEHYKLFIRDSHVCEPHTMRRAIDLGVPVIS